MLSVYEYYIIMLLFKTCVIFLFDILIVVHFISTAILSKCLDYNLVSIIHSRTDLFELFLFELFYSTHASNNSIHLADCFSNKYIPSVSKIMVYRCNIFFVWQKRWQEQIVWDFCKDIQSKGFPWISKKNPFYPASLYCSCFNLDYGDRSKSRT